MPTKLWNRNFILWLLGAAQSQLGSALASIGLSFLVLHQTGSAGRMAQTLALSLAPYVLMPFAGAVVDRLNLKVPLMAADVARGLLQLMVGGLALAWGEVPLWLVNAAALLGGLATIFANPASSAAVPGLVPERELARANGLLGSVNQGLWLLGTLAGGWLVSRWSPALAIVLDGVGFLIFAAVLGWVQVPPRPSLQASSGVLADVRAGLRLMRRSRVLRFVPVIGFVLNAVLAPVTVVLPKLMETLGAGARGYGLYLALESAGMLLAGALIAGLGQSLPPRLATAAGFVTVTLAYAGMWAGPVFPVLLACALVLGFGLGLLNMPLTTLMQQMVPAAYLGRVFAVLGAASSLGMPLALAAVSPLVDRLPVTLWFALSAGVMALGTLAWVAVVRAERGTAKLDVPREVIPLAD